MNQDHWACDVLQADATWKTEYSSVEPPSNLYSIRNVRRLISSPIVSATTQRLIDLLIARDQAGRAKYGATLDRTDLTHEQWLQHMVEELLDGAGYALAAIRTNPESKA